MPSAPITKFLEDWRNWLKKEGRWNDFEEEAYKNICKLLQERLHPKAHMTKCNPPEEWIRIK